MPPYDAAAPRSAVRSRFETPIARTVEPQTERTR